MTQHATAPAVTRKALATLGAVALTATGFALATAPAQAAEQEITDATFAWGINDESGGGAFFGGCNFLVAGEAGDTGSSRVWSEADGFYQTEVGNVRIEKPAAGGGFETPTWASKCVDASGTRVNTQAGSTTDNRFVFSAGAGSVDVAAGTATIAWDGSATIVYYGGMTYWTINDPVLVVADGEGQITATATGYGADMNDPSKWVQLEPTEIVIADLSDVQLDEDGFSATPDYLGVAVDVQPDGPSGPQVRTGAAWGGFPQSFVDFNVQTGQAAYWYSSGGAVDPKKPTNPLTVGWTADDSGEPEPEPGDGEPIPIEVTVPQDDPDPEPEPGEFSWTINGTGAVSLGQATANASGFRAEGTLHPVVVTDTRADAPAFSVSGQVGSFRSGSNSIPASALGWTPSLVDNTVGAVAGDDVAPNQNGGLGTSRTLVSAPAGHASGSVQVSTGLELLAPANTPAGSYSATLTLTALS